MTLDWPWSILRQSQIWSHRLSMEKVKIIYFLKTIAAFVSSWTLFSIARFIAVVSVLHVILALWPPVPQSSCPLCFLLVFYSFVFVVRSCSSGEPRQNQGRGLDRPQTSSSPPPPPPSNLYCWPSQVRVAGDHLYGILLFTWLSLVVSMMVSFCAVLFPMRCLGWDLDLIESVSEGFLSYSWVSKLLEAFSKMG